MRRIFTCLLVLFAFSQLVQSQETKVPYLNNVNLELGGAGFAGSLSYERLIPVNESNTILFAPSIGFAQVIWYPTFILQGNFLFGKKVFFETGFASTFYEERFHATLRFGIRYHDFFNRRFFYRASWTTTYLGDKWQPIPGIGIGYNF